MKSVTINRYRPHEALQAQQKKSPELCYLINCKWSTNVIIPVRTGQTLIDYINIRLDMQRHYV